MKKILIIASHPDDEILGCGGTIARHQKSNDNVCIQFLSNGVTSRNTFKKKDVQIRLENAKKACAVLGVKNLKFENYPDNMFDTVALIEIIKSIEKIVFKFKPNIIYTHSKYDLNIDHQITHRAVMTACRPIENKFLEEIYSFEVLSSTEWSTDKELSFKPNHYVDISKCINLKVRAMKKYADELRIEPHPRSISAIKSLALLRGSACGVKFAEGFMLERRIIK